MSLRRTGIARKTQLRRTTPMPRRKREQAARVKAAVGRRRDTGPTPAQRALVAERAGYRCERCGVRLHSCTGWTLQRSWHHRQARGMGSTRRPETNEAYNLLLLCGSGVDGCHGFIESHRTAAEAEGWLVRHGQDPANVPVTVHAGLWAHWFPDGNGPRGGDRVETAAVTRRVLLTADGEYQEVAV